MSENQNPPATQRKREWGGEKADYLTNGLCRFYLFGRLTRVAVHQNWKDGWFELTDSSVHYTD